MGVVRGATMRLVRGVVGRLVSDMRVVTVRFVRGVAVIKRDGVELRGCGEVVSRT